jgi:uncharacterized small protein (TIGR04563 family)
VPDYLHFAAFDWSWGSLNEDERKLAKLHEARLQADPTTHTLETFKQAVVAASRDLPGRAIVAVAEDDYDEWFFTATDGCLEELLEPETYDGEGAFPDILTAEDYRRAGVDRVCMPLYFKAETLKAMSAEAARLDRSLSWIVQKGWLLAKGIEVRSGALPDGGDRTKQSLYYPIDIYDEVEREADAEDRSKSWIVVRALDRAWPAIQALTPEA